MSKVKDATPLPCRFDFVSADGITHIVTLIVSTLAGNCPLLLGDLIISVPGPVQYQQAHLPIQDVECVGDADYTITSLSQKTCVVMPNLAVAWSGRKIAAKTIILEMMQTFTSGRPVTLDELVKFFHDLNFPETNDVQMVGLVLEEKNTVRGFGWNARTYNSLLLGEMQLAGSGSDHFVQVLQNFDGLRIIAGNPSDFFAAVGKLLTVAGAVLGEEIHTRSNLPHFYGGGLEIVSFNQGKFEKIKEITYIFWEVIFISPEEYKTGIQLAVKFSYTKDILLIHRVDFRVNVSPTDRVILSAVGPIHRNLDDTDIKELKGTALPDLNSHIMCHHFSINRPNATPVNLVWVDIGQPGMVEFANKGNTIHFDVHKKFVERLEKSIRERMRA
jgi:hypothetical protein